MKDIEQLAIDIKELAGGLEADTTKAKRELDDTRSLYRQIPGPVIKDILRDLRFMQIARSDNDVVLQAYATIFLRKLGVLEKDGASQEAVNRLLQPLVLSEGDLNG